MAKGEEVGEGLVFRREACFPKDGKITRVRD